MIAPIGGGVGQQPRLFVVSLLFTTRPRAQAIRQPHSSGTAYNELRVSTARSRRRNLVGLERIKSFYGAQPPQKLGWTGAVRVAVGLWAGFGIFRRGSGRVHHEGPGVSARNDSYGVLHGCVAGESCFD